MDIIHVYVKKKILFRHFTFAARRDDASVCSFVDTERGERENL